MNKELRERLEWLAYRCDDPRITPDVQDDVKYALEYIDSRDNIINELEKEISKHIALCTDITLNDILDKLQELKGSVGNENRNEEDNK